MNFFGHSVLALWQDPRAAFGFGAMWPDFAGMLQLSSSQSSDAGVNAGVVFHHQVDAVFHGSPHFLEFARRASAQLQASGVPRGAARAIAHVGVELLLDAELSRDEAARQHYVAVLTHAETQRFQTWLPAIPAEEALRFEQLRRLLLQRVERLRPENAAEVTERLTRVLAPRPRLALPAASVEAVTAWVSQTWPEIQRTRDDWCHSLRCSLNLPNHARC